MTVAPVYFAFILMYFCSRQQKFTLTLSPYLYRYTVTDTVKVLQIAQRLQYVRQGTTVFIYSYPCSFGLLHTQLYIS